MARIGQGILEGKDESWIMKVETFLKLMLCHSSQDAKSARRGRERERGTRS
jgi:hypothetical protein